MEFMDKNLRLLIATPDQKGIIRFPPWPSLVDSEPYWGIPLERSLRGPEKAEFKPVMEKVFGQNMDFLWTVNPLIDEALTPSPEKNHLDKVGPSDLEPGTRLRLIQVTLPLAETSWLSMPAILRSLPATRIRVLYLKVFQVLMGQHEEKTNAITVDELKKHLLKNPKAEV